MLCNDSGVEKPASNGSSQLSLYLLGDESESRLYCASFHPSHLLLHSVKVKVERAVFLPESEASDQSHIGNATRCFLSKLVQFDELTSVLHTLTTKRVFWQKILGALSLINSFIHMCQVAAQILQAASNLDRLLVLLKIAESSRWDAL